MNLTADSPAPRQKGAAGWQTDPRLQAERLRYAGIHRQEDRDARAAARAAGVDRKFRHMIRLRIPLGTITAEQYLALDRLSERLTHNRSLRVTTGQGFQLHGVPGTALKDALRSLHEIRLTTGCNPDGLEYAVAGPPLPLEQRPYRVLRQLETEICDALYPTLNTAARYPDHPPRKFTIGLALPEDNSANMHAHDVGLLLVNADGPALRVNVLAGGGLSMPGRRPGSYARLATPMGSVPYEAALNAVRAIAGIFRQHGQIATRRFTRLKYVLDQMGVARFRDLLEERLGRRLDDWISCAEFKSQPWLGPRDQGGGRICYGIKMPSGRIMDTESARYKTAIRAIVAAFRPTVIAAPSQDLILAGLGPEAIQRLEKILRAYHVPHGAGLSPVRARAMACVGLPTCPLALAESERVAEPLLRELERELVRIGRRDSGFVFRISGCSIGCIRSNMVDFGMMGRKPGHYDLFVGGDETTGRFAELYAEKVPRNRAIATIRPLLEYWGTRGLAGESFSNFYHRCFGGAESKTHLELVNESPAQARVEQVIRGFSPISA